MNLDITLVRDILFNWDSSPQLNAARAFESRQPYSNADRLFPKRLVPVTLGRALALEDPNEAIFYIQVKALPVECLDQYTPSPEYAVIWPKSEWRQSTEYRWAAVQSWATDRASFLIKNAHADRIHRMAAKIIHFIPKYQHIGDQLHQYKEEELRRIIASFEQVLNITIYEEPLTQEAGRPAQSPRQEVPPVDPAPPQEVGQGECQTGQGPEGNRQTSL
jgi:hypothetical protein